MPVSSLMCSTRVQLAPRIDHDVADVLGRREPHARPRLARVRGLVDAVAEVRAALALVLARAQPHHVRVLRIDHDAAQRKRAAVVEDGPERDPRIRRLPQPAERGGDVPDARIQRVDLDVLDAAGDERRADAAHREALQHVSVQAVRARARRLALRLARVREQTRDHQQARKLSSHVRLRRTGCAEECGNLAPRRRPPQRVGAEGDHARR
jgi:hypothetical protein